MLDRVAAIFLIADNLPYIKGEIASYIAEADWQQTLEEILSADCMKTYFALEVAPEMLAFAPISMAPCFKPDNQTAGTDNSLPDYPTSMGIDFVHMETRLNIPGLADNISAGNNTYGLVDGKSLQATDFIYLGTGTYYEP